MLIEASVRPKNVKRGVSTKKLCQALGFKGEVGLSEMVGSMSLSATDASEFAFLSALFQAIHPISQKPTKITIEVDGKTILTYGYKPKQGKQESLKL